MPRELRAGLDRDAAMKEARRILTPKRSTAPRVSGGGNVRLILASPSGVLAVGLVVSWFAWTGRLSALWAALTVANPHTGLPPGQGGTAETPPLVGVTPPDTAPSGRGPGNSQWQPAAVPLADRYGHQCPDDLAAAIEHYFSRDQWVNAASIAYAESGYNAGAQNDTTNPQSASYRGPCGTRYSCPAGTCSSENSQGYFQVNTCAHGHSDDGYFLDTDQNVAYAAQLYATSGWCAWGTAPGLGLC